MKKLAFLFFLLTFPITLAQTITIGVMPSELSLYKGESWVTFKFFNTYGEVDAYYIFIGSENVTCIQNCRVLVPKGTTMENPVRADVKLNVKNSGYIYITAKPVNESEEGGQVNIIQRVGIKVNCLNCENVEEGSSSQESSSKDSSTTEPSPSPLPEPSPEPKPQPNQTETVKETGKNETTGGEFYNETMVVEEGSENSEGGTDYVRIIMIIGVILGVGIGTFLVLRHFYII